MVQRAAPSLFDSVAIQVDGLRRRVWQVAARIGIGRSLIADRNARLTTLASLHMVTALALALTLPGWLLLVGPIVLGVPHVVADIRYLLLRPIAPLARAARVGILVPLTLLVALRVVNVLGGPEWLWLEVACGVAALLAGTALAEGQRRRQIVLLALAAALSVAAVLHPIAASLTMVHLHNFVALGLFVLWSRRAGFAGHTLLITAVFAICVALLLSGVLAPLGATTAVLNPASGIDLEGLAAAIAPGLSEGLAMRVLLVFAFAQAVHYTIWLRLIPGSAPFEPQRAPTTFRRNLGRLRSDVGRLGLRVVLGLSLVVPLAALFDPLTTREIYFSVVVFHGWLEIAVFAALLVGRR
ncbi:MAG: hypothetical protein KC609_16160 [Myxococcales bacterium]|nr:hypothetical protein [Myxococcales bacterium]